MTKTPLTERERVVLAAWFARSNMGQERSPRAEVQKLLTQKYPVSVQGATVDLCGEFMDSRLHERIFEEEADGWYKSFKKYKYREALLKIWPELDAYFWTEPPTFEHDGVAYYVIQERGYVSLQEKEEKRFFINHKLRRAALEAYKKEKVT